VSKSEPIFNVPPIVTATIAALVLVHVGRALLLPSAYDEQLFLYEFAFIPARYSSSIVYPGGAAADIWTFVTYALIHGDTTHLLVNIVWLLPFGSAVAQRFGPLRYLTFFAVTAAAGAALHFAFHPVERVPLVGASAAISGLMAASMRFVFQKGGLLSVFRRDAEPQALHVPAAPLTAVWKDTRMLAFLGVWFAVNIIFGLGSLTIADAEQSIAWQAHIGGFLAGLLAFAAFDPVPRASAET
jgi:membrane associated rhomboid family serine protease